MSHRAISRDNRLLPSNERHRNVYTLTKGIRSTQHIPKLSNEKHAEAMLERLRREFHPLAQARGYTIPTLTEMCCCSDGIHHYKTTTTKTTSTGRTITRTRKLYGRRRFRRMSNNVQGYNYGNGRGGKHEIHIRLRRPSSHTFYSYEHVAGVMIHELTHCEIGPHSAAFYELMDDIADQFNRYLEKGIVVDKQGFPLMQDQTYRLGGSSTSGISRIERSGASTGRTGGSGRAKSGTTGVSNVNDGRSDDTGTASLGEMVQERKRARQAEAAATKRNQRKGHKLGTGPTSSKDDNNQLTLLPNGTLGRGGWKKLTPKEAARRAAERRLEDSVWCLPCDEAGEILDLTSETSSDDEFDDDDDIIEYEDERDVTAEGGQKTTGLDDDSNNKEETSELKDDLKERSTTVNSSINGGACTDEDAKIPAETTTSTSTTAVSSMDNEHNNHTTTDTDISERSNPVASRSHSQSRIAPVTVTSFPSHESARASVPNSEATTVVDLTLDDDDEDLGNIDTIVVVNEGNSLSSTVVHRSSRSSTTYPSTLASSSIASSSRRREQRGPSGNVVANEHGVVDNSWSCPTCTYRNSSQLHLSCVVCGTPKVIDDESKLQKLQETMYNKDDEEILSKETAAKILRRDNVIEQQKVYEQKRSQNEFGGFNIYGAKKQNTRTMGHIT